MSIADVIPSLAMRYGQTVTIAWPPTGGVDPVMGQTGTPPAPASVQAVATEATDVQINGVTVLQGDVFVTIAASVVAQRPVVGCAVTVAGATYRVVSVREPRSAGAVLGYRLKCRAAKG